MNNDLKSLPPVMGELRKLECFYVQHNDIPELPDFTGCEALKEIHISNNYIKEIPGEFCENLPQLKVLDLRDNKIEKLPDEIAMLQSLMRLDLSNNSINSLPSGLSTLSHLMSLQLDGNPIRSIRRDIIQCGTQRILKTLREREGKKQIQSTETIKETIIPDIYQMKKARGLIVCSKNVSEMPEKTFLDAKEADVHNVDLSRNRFTTVPEGLAHLVDSLTELNLGSNALKAMPSFIGQFERINYINISNNMLESLPEEIGLLVTLRELVISNNHFKEIPNCIYELRGLEILLARDNKIEEIDATQSGLGALKRLATLDLANNNIKSVPPILGNLKNIT